MCRGVGLRRCVYVCMCVCSGAQAVTAPIMESEKHWSWCPSIRLSLLPPSLWHSVLSSISSVNASGLTGSNCWKWWGLLNTYWKYPASVLWYDRVDLHVLRYRKQTAKSSTWNNKIRKVMELKWETCMLGRNGSDKSLFKSVLEEQRVYGSKDLWKKCVLSLEQKRKGVMNGESVEKDEVTSV